MAYEVQRAADIATDLELIFDFLISTAEAFGDTPEDAFASPEKRLRAIEARMDDLGRLPHQGTLRSHLGDGIRNVTKERAIYYYDVDDDREVLRVLAVFFGGQDHEARILLRLLS